MKRSSEVLRYIDAAEWLGDRLDPFILVAAEVEQLEHALSPELVVFRYVLRREIELADEIMDVMHKAGFRFTVAGNLVKHG